MPAEPAEVFGLARGRWGVARTGTPPRRRTSKRAYKTVSLVRQPRARIQRLRDHPAVADGGVDCRENDERQRAPVPCSRTKARNGSSRKPKSELILDNYTIPTHAPDVDQAYSFINYMLEPAHQVADCTYLGYPLLLPGHPVEAPREDEARRHHLHRSKGFRAARAARRAAVDPGRTPEKLFSQLAGGGLRRCRPGRGVRERPAAVRQSQVVAAAARSGGKSSSEFVCRTRSMPSSSRPLTRILRISSGRMMEGRVRAVDHAGQDRPLP